MLTKEECYIALNDMYDCTLVSKDDCEGNREILSKLIQEHFELVEKVEWLKEEMTEPAFNLVFSTQEFLHNWYKGIQMYSAENDVLKRKVSEYENPQPYKFEDLNSDMWVWDDKNEMFILITFIDKQFKKMHVCLTEYDGFNDEYVNVEYTEYFEEGRFFPVTKAIEYQNKGNKVNESKDNIK